MCLFGGFWRMELSFWWHLRIIPWGSLCRILLSVSIALHGSFDKLTDGCSDRSRPVPDQASHLAVAVDLCLYYRRSALHPFAGCLER